MTVTGHVSSPVALSEKTPFRRKFSSVFDTLQNTELDFDQLLPALYEHQPPDSELIAGTKSAGWTQHPTSGQMQKRWKNAYR